MLTQTAETQAEFIGFKAESIFGGIFIPPRGFEAREMTENIPHRRIFVDRSFFFPNVVMGRLNAFATAGLSFPIEAPDAIFALRSASRIDISPRFIFVPETNQLEPFFNHYRVRSHAEWHDELIISGPIPDFGSNAPIVRTYMSVEGILQAPFDPNVNINDYSFSMALALDSRDSDSNLVGRRFGGILQNVHTRDLRVSGWDSADVGGVPRQVFFVGELAVDGPVLESGSQLTTQLQAKLSTDVSFDNGFLFGLQFDRVLSSFDNSAELTAVTLAFPDGTEVTPESLGLSVSFASGMGSPNVPQTTVIPEPSTFVLLGIGAVGLLGYGWRRKRHRGA